MFHVCVLELQRAWRLKQICDVQLPIVSSCKILFCIWNIAVTLKKHILLFYIDFIFLSNSRHLLCNTSKEWRLQVWAVLVHLLANANSMFLWGEPQTALCVGTWPRFTKALAWCQLKIRKWFGGIQIVVMSTVFKNYKCSCLCEAKFL